MRFIAFWWYSPENTQKYLEKYRQLTAEREKGTDKSPALVFGPHHFAGQCKGFSVYDADDPGKLTMLADFYAPELTFKFVPLVDNKDRAELYFEAKK